MQLHFAAFHGPAQAAAEGQATLGILHLLDRKFDDAIAALALGPMHGGLGAAQEILRVEAVVG